MTTLHSQPDDVRGLTLPARPVSAFPASAMFAPFPLVCFTLTLVTDILYWRTSFLMWSNFSDWLLFFGLIFGAIALIAGLIDLMRPATRALRPTGAVIIAFFAVLLLAFLNSFIHAGDGWTAIVPYGLLVSAVTVVACLVTVWLAAEHRATVYWRSVR